MMLNQQYPFQQQPTPFQQSQPQQIFVKTEPINSPLKDSPSPFPVFNALKSEDYPQKKSVRRNKQKHNETERRRREQLAQLFEDMKILLRDDDNNVQVDLENRNAVLEQAILKIRKLKAKADSQASAQTQQDKFEEIPGLKQLVDYIDDLKLQLTKKRKVNTELEGHLPKKNLSQENLLHHPGNHYQANPENPPALFQEFVSGQDIDFSSYYGFLQSTPSPHSETNSYSDTSSPENFDFSQSGFPPSMSVCDVHANMNFVQPNQPQLPDQSTAGAEFSRFLFSVLFLFGFFLYSWDVQSANPTTPSVYNLGRVLQEHSIPISTMGFWRLWEDFLAIQWLGVLHFILPIIGFLFFYMLFVIIMEPVMSRTSFFYQEAQKQHQKALNNTMKSKKYHLRALAFLGRAFPSGLPLILGIILQGVRYLMHCIYIGVWLDKLILVARGGEASHKKAADLYLSLLRNCNGRMRALDLLYLSLCTINISHLFDSIWVAETYAHVSFFFQYKFPSLKLLNSLLLQLAWRIAKKEKKAQFQWLLFATAHRNLKKGEWKDADLYLQHIATELKNLEQVTTGPLPASAQSLRRYTTVSQAIVQLGIGNLPRALSLTKEAERYCINPDAPEQYTDTVIARIAMMISTVCLLKMDRTKEAVDMLQTFKREHDRAAETVFPCAMLRTSLKSLLAISFHRSDNLTRALEEADEAFKILKEDDSNFQLWIWPVYTTLVEVYLDAWQIALQKQKSRSKEKATQSSQLSSQQLDTIIDVEDQEDKENRQLIKHLAHQVDQCIMLCEERTGYWNSMHSSVLRIKANYYFNMGEREKAFKLWKQGLDMSRSMNMTYEEAKVLYESGKHKLQCEKCICESKRRHQKECPVSSLEAAHLKFIQCGAVYDSRRAIEAIQFFTAEACTSV